MSYIDAYWDKKLDQIHIVEREKGKRLYNKIPAKYVVYYEDELGQHKTVFGTKAACIVQHKYRKFQLEIANLEGRRLFESDVSPLLRCLSENYYGKEPPKLNICFFDIEVATHPEKGFAPPNDPFNEVTAIGMYLSQMDKLICLALKPKNMSVEEAQEIAGRFDNTFVFDDEKEMLDTFLSLIEDSDVLSGWNSTLYDIPYLINRITLIMGKEYTKKFCLWDLFPKKRNFIRFKREQSTYDLTGRIHLDYLDLYQQYTYVELHTYKLDFVGEYEVGEKKVTLDLPIQKIYEDHFEKFIEYNRQDVMLLVKIDEKLKFMNLANTEAHMTTVRLPDVLGTVKKVEQAVINEAHRRGMIVPNRSLGDNEDEDDEFENENVKEKQAAGAYVADPITGIHEYIGSVDINSLYPSAIRSLNMAPETLFGQLRQDMTKKYLADRLSSGVKRTDLWIGRFACLEYEEVMNKTDTEIILDIENGKSFPMKAKEIYELIFESGQDLCISANGTIFRTDNIGVIPGLLTKWYSDRKIMQGKAKKAEKEGNDVEYEYWDQRQLIQKILLNSTYGALLNKYCRFYDERIGQSTTLTGRCITRHMISKINEIITGDYDVTGKAISYSDTDSCYFTSFPMMKEKHPEVNDWFTDEWKNWFILEYDRISDETNKTFSSFMKSAFNIDAEQSVIKAGREVVGLRGLFVKKKKYAILVYDKEGKREDMVYDDDFNIIGKKIKNGVEVSGKMKVLGLDLKRSDTPKPIQQFLEKVLYNLLDGKPKKDIMDLIRDYRSCFQDLPAWEKGSPKKINGLFGYSERERKSTDVNLHMNLNKELLKTRDKNKVDQIKKQMESNRKITMPGHVRASINWNKMLETYTDRVSKRIEDGDKIVVCKLRPNPTNFSSIAYPVDIEHVPDWFKKLPFDDSSMEAVLIDKKLNNFLGILKWDLNETKRAAALDNFFTKV